ncbi:MAG: VanZ family protein [Melioribacteraceae bacterium]|nr:VanZ family protein [Melioribacteraceae bacterium]WKZ68319.1 MAG: VanZ family protein [Melioribacteraceae bacterium]
MLKLLIRNKKWFIYIPLTVHWISIFILTSLPDKDLPSVNFDDKIKHFIAYFVLSFFLSLALNVQNKFKRMKESYIKFALLITLIYSTFDEIHQVFIPGRSAEFWDWLANMFGILLGVFLVKSLVERDKSKQLSKNGTEIG